MPKITQLHNELIVDAEQNLQEAQAELSTLAEELYKAYMALYAAEGDEEFLTDDERSTLAEGRESLNEITDRIKFWEERLNKLQSYKPTLKFYSKVHSDFEIDNLLDDLSENF